MNYIAEEHARIDKAYQIIGNLLCDRVQSLEAIAEKTNMSLTELRYDGWEKLYDYIRSLEKQVEHLHKQKDEEAQKQRNLLLNIENAISSITGMYRESRIDKDYRKDE